MGNKSEQVIQLGAEGTPGTAVAATTIWRGEGGQLSDDRETEFVPERIGYTMPTLRTYVPKIEGSLAMAATPATFEQTPYLCEAGIILETPAQDGAGSDYIYEYPVGETAVNSIRSYTIETGDEVQAQEMAYCFVKDFTLSGDAGGAVMQSANWIGRQPSNTTITDLISAGPQVVEEILAGKGVFAIDALGGTFGATNPTSPLLLKWELKVTTGWVPLYSVDSGELYFVKPVFDIDQFEAVLDVTYEHSSAAVTEQNTNWRGQVAQLFQIRVNGSGLGTPGTVYSTKAMIIDMAGKYEKFDALDSENGNSIVKGTIRGGYDDTETTSDGFKMTFVNELSALV